MLPAIVGLSALAQAGWCQLETGAMAVSPEPPVPPPISLAPQTLRLAAGTPLEIELADTLSSGASKLGDRFTIRLTQAISRDGADVVAAGAMGQGEVIDVARAGINGKQGKLIIAARSLDLNGRQVRVRGLSLMAAGKSRVDLATGALLVPYASPIALLIKGGDIEMPAGTRAMVRLVEDVDLPRNPITQTGGKTE